MSEQEFFSKGITGNGIEPDKTADGSSSEAGPSSEAGTSSTPPDLVLIGGNCHVKGEIRNCRRLEIEGRLEGDFETEEIIVQNGGNINGKLKTKNAEIHGAVEGELIVQELLDIRQTGKVSGNVDYGKLAVETGGQLTGALKNKGNSGNAPDTAVSETKSKSSASVGNMGNKEAESGSANETSTKSSSTDSKSSVSKLLSTSIGSSNLGSKK